MRDCAGCGAAGAGLVIIALISAARVTAITNQDVPVKDSDSSEYTDIPQFQPYTQQLQRPGLSPHQQNQILNDIQQHRFQQTSAQRHLQSLQQFEQPPSRDAPPAVEQSLGLGQQPFLTNAQYLAHIRQQQQQQLRQQQQFQQGFQQRPQPQQPLAFQPPTKQIYQEPQVNSGGNLNLRNQFQQEFNRLLASQQFAGQLNNQNFNEEIPVFFPPQDGQQQQQTYEFEPAPPTNPTKTNFKFEPAQPKPTYTFEPAPEKPSFKFEPAPEKPSFKFEPAPEKPSFKFEPAPPKPTYKFEPAPSKPSYKFEPAPPKPTYRFEPASSKPSYTFEPAPTKQPIKYENKERFLPTQPTTRQTTYNYLKKKKASLTTTVAPASTTGIPYRLRYNKFKTTTESPKPQVSIRPTQLFIKPDRQKLFQQLYEAQQKQTSTTPAPKVTPKQNVVEFESEDELQKHIQQQLQKQGLLDEIRGTIPATSDQIDALPNLDFLSGANSSSPIYLPNGQNIKIIQVPSKIDPNSKKPTPKIKTIVINQPTTTTTTTTVKPPELLLKELTRGLPSDFEIIRQTQDGGLEELGMVPQGLPQKKVTFVILEEQADGTLKVQGVRGNENGQKANEGEDVKSIIQKIEKGEIKLPKSTKLDHEQPSYTNSLANATPEESVESPSYVKHSGKPVPKFSSFQPTPSPNFYESSTKASFNFAPTRSTTSSPITYPSPTRSTTSSPITYQSPRRPSSVLPTAISSPNTHGGPVFSFPSSSGSQKTVSPAYRATTPRSPAKAPSFLPTVPSDFGEVSFSSNSVVPTQSTTTTYTPPPSPSTTATSLYSPINVSPQSFDDEFFKQLYQQNSSPRTSTVFQSNNQFSQKLPDVVNSNNNNQVYQPQSINFQVDPAYTTTEPLPIQQVNQEAAPSTPATGVPALVDVFRNQGLYAMSKFLRQSGLDAVLNTTGPYTVFVPTDRAFRALLVQLGGPDKAEEKFQENPRLLSGLLLHHVIPGAFPLSTLQDEMTGVSLAGTQLRVNTYTTQDEQWNDVKVLTINGAVVMPDKKDMVIPQGVAHAVDRVMFPLPVGDVIQTLQSDRENRFTRFLQLIQDSGLTSMLTGSKILTVFAPVDSAFTDADVKRFDENRAQARSAVLRHIATGTLYSAGMQYYQQRESLDKTKQITVIKEAGRIKVNSANVISRNIPTTNGVIHAIDSLL